jgi:hypothetical protein
MESQDSFGTPITQTDFDALLESIPATLDADDDSTTDVKLSQLPESSQLSIEDRVEYDSALVIRAMMRDLC